MELLFFLLIALVIYGLSKLATISETLRSRESDLMFYKNKSVSAEEFGKLLVRVRALETHNAELRRQLQLISTGEKEISSNPQLSDQKPEWVASKEIPPRREAPLPSATMMPEQILPTVDQASREATYPPPHFPTVVVPEEEAPEPLSPPTAVQPEEKPLAPPAPPTAVPIEAPVNQRASEPPRQTPSRTPLTDTLISSRPSRRMTDWETLIGGEWLSKIGVGILVIGISLALGYSFQFLGPLGKILFGFAASSTLLVGGVVSERKEQYRLYARGLIGGGWALAYFTTYAMHHLEAVRIIESPLLALTLLYLVAGGIIAHSLKYQSQLITGMAYLLGFLTLAVSQGTVFSLGAALILAASLVLISWRMNWCALGLVGLLAAYGNYFLWLYPIIQASPSHTPLPQPRLTALFLILFWVVFTVPNFLLRPGTVEEEETVQGINLTNALLLFSLFAYQGRNPELRYLFLTGFGFAYVGLSYLSKALHQRISYLLFMTIGTGSLVAAVPSALSGSPVTLLWLLQAEVLLLAGFYLRESYVRKLGGLVFALVFIFMAGDMVWRWIPARFIETTDLSHGAIGVVALAAAVLYANGHKLYPIFRDRIHDPEARRATSRFSWGGFVLSVLLIRFLLGVDATVVGWMIFSLILFELGGRYRQGDLRVQAYTVALLAFGRLFPVDFLAGEVFLGISARLMTVTLVAACLYYLAYRIHRGVIGQRMSSQERLVSRGMLYAAGLLVTVLLGTELPVVALAVGWAALGVVLVGLGRHYANWDLRIQGYLVSVLAAGRMVLVNFSTAQDFLGLSQRMITVPIIVLCSYYLYWQLRAHRRRGLLNAGESFIPEAYSYYAAATLSGLILAQFDAPQVILAWSGLAFVYLVIGLAFRMSALRIQGYLITALAFSLATIINLGAEDERALTVGSMIAILYGSLTLSLLFHRASLRTPESIAASGSTSVADGTPLSLVQVIDAYAPSLYFYSATTLLTLLLAVEVGSGWLTLWWALEGLSLFVIGLIIRERMFRLSGLVMLVICTLKIFVLDLADLDSLMRIFSLIGLGLILLLVSYLYTRYREYIRRFL